MMMFKSRNLSDEGTVGPREDMLGSDPHKLPLMRARNVCLHVPIVKPSESRVLSNPLRLVTDLYFSRQSRSIVTLIDHISLCLLPGERLGLIGPNGAGKSTFLRLLAGIYRPSSGELEVNGTAKGLFDVSLGMHQEATGIENIYLRGLQMGLRMGDIRKLIGTVLEFSELGDAIEKPVVTYSAGMRLRLAVAISTMIEPDILLLDEWIGTGDASFNKKIQARMFSLVEKSRGLVLASHNVSLMKSLCTHGLVLAKGKAQFYGTVDDALQYYSQMDSSKNQSASAIARPLESVPKLIGFERDGVSGS
jgi:ABC-type polysaccharide/polyol phosphate transport system ATPase subunit